MKLLALHPGAELPSARIRVVQMAPHLAALGHELTPVAYPRTTRERRELVRAMESADCVWLHYRLPTLADALLWRGLETPIVYDFDDAVLFRQEPKNGSHESRTRQRRFERVRTLASGFTCGNRYLESLVAETGKPTCILPTPVPLDVPRRSAHAGAARIGWIGGRGNLGSLEALGEALRTLALERAFTLVVISDAAPTLSGVEVEHIPWTLAGQEPALATLDVGLMPLDDTPWNRGKCAYKLLQYMAAEVVAVGSPVGMNAELIDDGRNGCLADTRREWTATLARLLADDDLRATIAREGRATVEADYGYPHLAARLAAHVEDVLATRATG